MTERNKMDVVGDLFAKYGFRLVGKTGVGTPQVSNSEEVGIEEAVIAALTERREPRFVQGVPYVLYRSQEKVDAEELYRLAREREIQNQVGYILDVCFEHFPSSFPRGTRLDRLRGDLFRSSASEERFFYEREERLDALVGHYLRNRSPLLKKWRLLGHFDTESFIVEFERCERLSKKEG
ncbi:MAG TPA: hypothetical protein VFE88_00135 [Candidatus Nanoarchaeia archaeon]|nr:hypothetical protein [Candidatus Nanoarchaeia archaeon]